MHYLIIVSSSFDIKKKSTILLGFGGARYIPYSVRFRLFKDQPDFKLVCTNFNYRELGTACTMYLLNLG